jgi:medium-chain acyl-[acyl-carrier-protein] hydrolase
MIYQSWSTLLPPKMEVCPIQLPGRGKRLLENPYLRLAPLVEDVAEAISPYLDRPFAFFGHSMGAMIGFELARLLHRERKPGPSYLIFSGRRAPHLPRTEPLTYNLQESEFFEKLRELDGTPEEVFESAELMKLMLPILRADFEVVQTYQHEPGEPLDCPFSVYGGLQDSYVQKEHLKAWSSHTASTFKLRMFPGNHFFIRTAQHQLLTSIAEDLQTYLRVLV